MEGKFYFSAKALIINDNKFLSLFTDFRGKRLMDLPGGRMEYGETPEQTLIREVKEEISLNVKPARLIDTWKHEGEDGFRVVGVIYHCEVLSGEFRINDEGVEYEWIDIKDIKKYSECGVLSDRMKNWNWEAIMESEVLFTNI